MPAKSAEVSNELDPVEFPAGTKGRIAIWYQLNFHVPATDGGGGFLGHYKTQKLAEDAVKKNSLDDIGFKDRVVITPVKVFTYGYGNKGMLLGRDFDRQNRVVKIGGKWGPKLW